VTLSFTGRELTGRRWDRAFAGNRPRKAVRPGPSLHPLCEVVDSPFRDRASGLLGDHGRTSPNSAFVRRTQPVGIWR
jgi:hypothetical protein